MSGFSKSTNPNLYSRYRRFFQAFPEIWPLTHGKSVQTPIIPQILTENDPLPPSKRLVVILPDSNIDVLSLPRRIWELAAPECRQVLFMIKPCREENEFYARMNLVTLSAMLRDARVHVETKLVLGIQVDEAARQCAQSDDIFVCFEEHCVQSLLQKKRLADLLAQKLKLPVYTLKGSVAELNDPISSRLIDFVLLVVSMALLIVFFALQVWIDRNTSGMFWMILQILTVTVEVWIVAVCANKVIKI